MRIDVRKFLFVGMGKDRAAFFEKAQEMGIIEFMDSKDFHDTQEMPSDIRTLDEAIKILRSLPIAEQDEIEDLSIANTTANCIIKLNYSIESLYEERRILSQEISRTEVFGNFRFEDLEYIEKEAGRKVQFFFSKEDMEVDAQKLSELIYIDSAHGLKYYISINRESVSYEGMVEMEVKHSLQDLVRRQKEVEKKIAFSERELRAFSNRNELLHKALIDKLNSYNLLTAQNCVGFMLNDSLFSIEGWVAESNVGRLELLLEEMAVYGDEIAIEERDKVPTYLENRGFQRIGEDLVHIYDAPSIRDKDPSSWVFGGFSLFFAIILGDGGYGFLFLFLSLFLWMKFSDLRGLGRRALKLFTVLSVSCILWGVLSNSFFGIKFHPDSLFRKFSIVHWLVEKKVSYHMLQKDDVYNYWVSEYPCLLKADAPRDFLKGAVREANGGLSYEALEKFSGGVMIELALLIGMIHIAISFLRGLRSSWAGVGWILCMLGGYLHFPSILQATSIFHFVLGLDEAEGAKEGLRLIYSGIGIAVIAAFMQNKLAGSMEITNLIQVFADVLSYLRLYALSLAGSMMSSTFNDIACSMGMTLGIIILLIGHFINIVLSSVGGVIHGLRLHFIEWYHYSFEGGGKMHNPLKLLNIK